MNPSGSISRRVKNRKMSQTNIRDTSRPALFLEITRDSLCDLALLESSLPSLAGSATLMIIEGGDHSFKVPKTQNQSQEAVFEDMMDAKLRLMRPLND
jgi:hypothetical protein